MNPMLPALREKAAKLPLSPGVYIMKDEQEKIIYIGKSKLLKNRVSQYFQDTARHNLKTQKMVSRVRDFEYMLTDTEMEALSLENRLIKLHQPKFNICLKDGKTYPYLKLNVKDPYPRLIITRKRLQDGALYFGPYSGSGTAHAILQTVERVFHLPNCKHQFPKDIGKIRPCLYAHMKQCVAPCNNSISQEDYQSLCKEVALFLRGSYRETEANLIEKMEYASENLMFEAAAQYRDRITALKRLQQRQKVVASPNTEQDVFALYSDELCTCLTVYQIREGCILDSCNYFFHADHIIDSDTLSSFLFDLYIRKETIPKEILLGFPMEEGSVKLLQDFLSEHVGHKIHFKLPERGQSRALCDMVYKDAAQHALHYQAKADKDNDLLIRFAQLLQLEVIPERIEAFDISNFGNDAITAGMIVVDHAKFSKQDYRVYQIKGKIEQDDYAAMREAIQRRLSHKELPYPDLLLLDGGKGHVHTITALLQELKVSLPVFGMVKDDFHKTRALTDGENEISIAKDQSIFTFVYRIQEEVHRFTIHKMQQAKQKMLKTYSLTDIPGIGPKKAKALLLHFNSMEELRHATQDQLTSIREISSKNATDIIQYFQNNP